MSIHYLSIRNYPYPCLDKISSGEKTVEGRVYDGQYKSYKKGDTIIFKSGKVQIKTKITYVHKYKTLEDYLKKETINKALPGISSMKEAVEIYNNWSSPGQRTNLLAENGYSFLGIGIQLNS